MSEVTCPECGTRTELPSIRRSADEFCSHCDFPLFWVPSAVPAMASGASNDAALRRLPGAGGRQRLGTKVCPECGEHNPMGETQCLRCAADLDPKPVVEELPPPPAPVVYDDEPVLPPAKRFPWEWVIAAIASAIVLGLLIWVA